MLLAWHNESVCAPDLLITPHPRRRVMRNNFSPELWPKADDKVHSSCGRARFTDSGDCRGELPDFLRVQNVRLQVRMRARSKSEDSRLGRVHVIDSATYCFPKKQ